MDGVADKSVLVRLGAIVEPYQAGMAQASATTRKLEADTKALQGAEEKAAVAARQQAAANESAASSSASAATRARNLSVVALGLGAVLLYSAYAANEHELAVAKLDNTFANAPQLAGVSTKAFQDQAESISQNTVVTRNQVMTGQAMLGQMGATATQIRELTPLVVDLARKNGIDLVAANKAVGMALDGKAGALKRLKVPLDEVLYKTDRYAAVTQAMGAAQGYATAEGKTFGGQLTILKNELHEVAEGLGVGAADAVKVLLTPLKVLADTMKSLSPPQQEIIGKLMGFTAAGLLAVGMASKFAGWISKVQTNLGLATTEARTATVANGELAASEEAAGMSAGVMSAAVSAGLAVGIAATVMFIARLNEASKTMQEDTFKDLDFTKATTTVDEFSKSLDKMRSTAAELDKMSWLDKALHITDGNALKDTEAQAEEHAKHIVDQNNRIAESAAKLGMQDGELRQMLAKLKVDPSTQSVAQLVAVLGELQRGEIDANTASKLLGGGLEDTGQGADEAAQHLKEAHDVLWGLADAERGYQKAVEKTADAERAAQKATEKVADARDAYRKATERVSDAEYNRLQANKRVAESVQSVEEAQKALNDLLAGPTVDDQLAARDAALSVAEANQKLAEAAAAARKAHHEGSGQEVTKADLDVQAAQLALDKARNDETKTGDKRAADLAAAQKNLEKAQDGLVQSQRDAKKAAEDVTTAQQEQRKAATGIADAQRDAAKASDAVRDAQYDQAKAADQLTTKIAEATTLFGEQGEAADALRGKLEALKAQFPELAAQYDALMATLNIGKVPDLVSNAVMNAAAGSIAAIAGGAKRGGLQLGGGVNTGGKLGNGNVNLAGGKAGGGSVFADRLTPVGEDQPELLRTGGRQYLIPGRDGFVVPAAQIPYATRSDSGRHISYAPTYHIDSGMGTESAIARARQRDEARLSALAGG